MELFGRLLVIVGAALVLLGLVVLLLDRLGFRGLPGDIHYRGDHVEIHFPIVTCLVLSLLLTALFHLWRWFQGR